MGKQEVMIRIRDLKKSFGSLQVLDGISLDVGKGEVMAILGPSGSGKSTLIRCINLLEKPTGGSIVLDGMEITGRLKKKEQHELHTKVGMVFQHFNLFPHMTVLDNMTFSPRKVLKLSRQEAEKISRELLEKAGYQNISVDTGVWKRIYGQADQFYNPTPIFTITATA